MSKTDRRFARFYYDDFIREYPEVYRDDAALAAWIRLLVVAEKAWPADPELPRSVKASALRTLTRSDLVAVGPDHTYAVRGYHAERLRRQAAGRAGADAKWGATADAIAHANGLLVREREQNENENPLPRRAGRRSDGTNQRAQGTNPRAQGTSPRQEREREKRGPSSLHEILTAVQRKPA